MKTKKQIGIWMDHSKAYLIDMSNDTIVTTLIESEVETQQSEESILKDESHMLNKEQAKMATYYKKLGEAIEHFDDVILFGPTDAKKELLNLLKDDNQFEKIKIEVKTTDKMNENQCTTFVKEYFNTSEPKHK